MWIVHKQEFGYQSHETRTLDYFGPFTSEEEAEDAIQAMKKPYEWVRYSVIKLTAPVL